MEVPSSTAHTTASNASVGRPSASPGSMNVSMSSQSANTDSRHSSGQTSRIKKRQSDRLSSVKKRTLAIVILADIALLTALAYQMIWLNDTLQATFDDKVRDLLGVYEFRYAEQFAHLSLGAQLYARNASNSIACRSLLGDAASQLEVQRRLGNDVRGRALEIGLVVDTAGTVMGTGGKKSALGFKFNPQNIVSEFYTHYPRATQPLQGSVMIPPDLFWGIGGRQFYTQGDYRPELRTWANFTETLTRVVLTPLQCGTSSAQGYLIWGDAWTPRQYDVMSRFTLATSSSLVAVLSRTPAGLWQTQNSYNHAGQIGWQMQFPDLVPYFDADTLDAVYAQGQVQSGKLQLGDVAYRYAMQSLPLQRVGSAFVTDIRPSAGLILYAEPEVPVLHTVGVALLWHVPFGVFMCLLSFVTLHFTFQKFLNPMKLLIESVKKKKLKEFNDRIRQMKHSRGALWTLVGKTVLVQGVLLGLIFVNRQLLVGNIDEFTSATTQGRVGPFVSTSAARSLMLSLNGWSGFGSVIQGVSSGNITDSLRSEILDRFRVLKADALYLLSKSSVILASTHGPAEGLVFPEVGVMEYYLNRTNDQMDPFTTLTSWHPTNVRHMTPRNFTLDNPPALIRLAVAPINYIDFNTSDESFVMGDVVGAVVLVRVLNGYDPLWDNIASAFGTGYYGLYSWDRFHDRFAPMTTLTITDTSTVYGVDISHGYPDMLLDAVQTTFVHDSVRVHDSVLVHDQSETVSVAPFFVPGDDVVLTPLVMSAYQVTGVPQERFNQLLARQLVIQSSIMVVEFITSMIALACTYWPMKSFLDSLEKAFNVPSLSHEKRQKMEERAAAMMEATRPETVLTQGQRQSGANLTLPAHSSRRSQ